MALIMSKSLWPSSSAVGGNEGGGLGGEGGGGDGDGGDGGAGGEGGGGEGGRGGTHSLFEKLYADNLSAQNDGPSPQ